MWRGDRKRDSVGLLGSYRVGLGCVNLYRVNLARTIRTFHVPVVWPCWEDRTVDQWQA